MYTAYFGLTEAPFAISPNPRYLYMSEAHREALAHLLYGIRSDGCMILLTGEVGTGKTTLCRCMLEQLPENTEVAVILNPRLTARELLKTICEEFGLLGENPIGSIKTYIDAINQHLLQAHANDRTIAIIVDEAQNLAIDVLEQLRLLTNLETPTRKLLRILLLGQPELRTILERPELSQINQRITSRYHLGPLDEQDIKAYIQHRLNVAGDHSASLFSPKAIKHAIYLTGGIPRLINVLCDRALLGAFALNSDHVDLNIMRQAGQEIFPGKYTREKNRRKLVLIAAVVLVMMALPALVFLPDLFRKSTAEQTPGHIQQSATKEAPIAQPQPDDQAVEAEQKTVTMKETENSASSVMQTVSPATTTTEAHLPPTTESPTTPVADPGQNKVPDSRQTTTITISNPFMVQEKAGPNPPQQASKLINK